MAKIINPVNHEEKLCSKVQFMMESYHTRLLLEFFFPQDIVLRVIFTQMTPLSQVLKLPFIFPSTEVAFNNPFKK